MSLVIADRCSRSIGATISIVLTVFRLTTSFRDGATWPPSRRDTAAGARHAAK